MDHTKLAGLLFPEITKTPEDYEAAYPARILPENAAVTRIAPSPTGFMHVGNLFGALIDERIAHQSGGTFYLRIEDTDEKRTVAGGCEAIIKAFSEFDLSFDEGAAPDGEPEKGGYGPYRQRQRAEIYRCFAKKLVAEGQAYPCFCTPEDLEAMRAGQEAAKENFGYYGKWAVHRDMKYSEIEKLIKNGTPYILRLRSTGDPNRRTAVDDIARGRLEMPENDQDTVLLKSDGIPTYHFAHVVDDHLMRTTHVVRGEEWLATLPIHIQLFRALGWNPPKYLHTPVIMKMDGDSKRKLSKRLDPESALEYYIEEGFPPEAVLEYLMGILNSGFEDWRRQNSDKNFREYKFLPKKISQSGALFDLMKLTDVSKNYISRMTAGDVYAQSSEWARRFDAEIYGLLTRDAAYSQGIFEIDRGGKKPRKDIAKWSEIRDYISYFYFETYIPDYKLPENITPQSAAEILSAYLNIYEKNHDKDEWFAGIKSICEPLNYAAEVKSYKQNPESYKGHVGDVSGVIRVAVTGRQNTPDLYQIMGLLGENTVRERINAAINFYKKESKL